MTRRAEKLLPGRDKAGYRQNLLGKHSKNERALTLGANSHDGQGRGLYEQLDVHHRRYTALSEERLSNDNPS